MLSKYNLNAMLAFTVLLTLLSCSNDFENEHENLLFDSQSMASELDLRKEVSLLIGQVLLNVESRNYAVDYAKFKNDDSESISLATLVGNHDKIPLLENVALEKARAKKGVEEPFSNHFKTNVLAAYNAIEHQLPMMQQMFYAQGFSKESLQASLANGAGLSPIFQTDAFSNYELYFPYEDEFDWGKVSHYAMSYAPENLERGTSDAFVYETATGTRDDRPILVDDDYAYENPTIVLMPVNDEDSWDGWVVDDEDPYIDPSTQYWLTQNVDHTKISQADVLRVTIPKMRLLDHYSSWPSKSKINIYKVAGKLVLNSNGTINTSEANSFQLSNQINVRRKKIRKDEWFDVNLTFDGDWDVHENNQQFVLFSIHNYGGKAEASGSVDIGYDEEKKEYTYEPKYTVDFEFTNGRKSKLKYNNEITRRDLLTHIVGDFGNDVYEDDGVKYHVRKADKLLFYFKLHYTDVPE